MTQNTLATVAILIIYIAGSDSVAGQMRVTGGKDASTNSAPYAVSLQQVQGTNSIHYCGGTIINANWVVTAAHCLSSRSLVSSSIIVAGSILVSGAASTVQKRDINFYVVHDLYVGGTAPYDIGLVYTTTAFQWTAAVKAAALPKAGAIPSGNALLYGWGSTSTTSTAKYPTTLQVSTVPVLTMLQCEKALGSLAVNLHDTNVCSGPLNGGVSICTSDSGGPLVQSNTLIGIVSWGKLPCGQVNSPSVFVRVSAFNSWIKDHQKVTN